MDSTTLDTLYIHESATNLRFKLTCSMCYVLRVLNVLCVESVSLDLYNSQKILFYILVSQLQILQTKKMETTNLKMTKSTGQSANKIKIEFYGTLSVDVSLSLLLANREFELCQWSICNSRLQTSESICHILNCLVHSLE